MERRLPAGSVERRPSRRNVFCYHESRRADSRSSPPPRGIGIYTNDARTDWLDSGAPPSRRHMFAGWKPAPRWKPSALLDAGREPEDRAGALLLPLLKIEMCRYPCHLRRVSHEALGASRSSLHLGGGLTTPPSISGGGAGGGGTAHGRTGFHESRRSRGHERFAEDPVRSVCPHPANIAIDNRPQHLQLPDRFHVHFIPLKTGHVWNQWRDVDFRWRGHVLIPLKSGHVWNCNAPNGPCRSLG
jgi:hypothetical protein